MSRRTQRLLEDYRGRNPLRRRHSSRNRWTTSSTMCPSVSISRGFRTFDAGLRRGFSCGYVGSRNHRGSRVSCKALDSFAIKCGPSIRSDRCLRDRAGGGSPHQPPLRPVRGGSPLLVPPLLVRRAPPRFYLLDAMQLQSLRRRMRSQKTKRCGWTSDGLPRRANQDTCRLTHRGRSSGRQGVNYPHCERHSPSVAAWKPAHVAMLLGQRWRLGCWAVCCLVTRPNRTRAQA